MRRRHQLHTFHMVYNIQKRSTTNRSRKNNKKMSKFDFLKIKKWVSLQATREAKKQQQNNSDNGRAKPETKHTREKKLLPAAAATTSNNDNAWKRWMNMFFSLCSIHLNRRCRRRHRVFSFHTFIRRLLCKRNRKRTVVRALLRSRALFTLTGSRTQYSSRALDTYTYNPYSVWDECGSEKDMAIEKLRAYTVLVFTSGSLCFFFGFVSFVVYLGTTFLRWSFCISNRVREEHSAWSFYVWHCVCSKHA